MSYRDCYKNLFISKKQLFSEEIKDLSTINELFCSRCGCRGIDNDWYIITKSINYLREHFLYCGKCIDNL